MIKYLNICTISFLYKILEEYPVIIAENRDTSINSKEMPPKIVSKNPKIFSVIDTYSEGTWFGLNEYGLVIGLTNLYPKNEKTKPNNSRGKLCLDILELSNAREVNYFLKDTFDLEKYQKLNIISADKDNAFVSICDKDIKTLPLDKGSHVLTNYNFKQIPKTKREEDSLMDSKYGRERAIELIEDCPIENLDDAIELLKCVCSDHKKSNYAGGSEFRKYFTICCHDDEIYPWKTSSSSIITLSKKRD